MRIGLLRHFRVDMPLPRGLRTAGELHAWLSRYDDAEPVVGPFDLGGIEWPVCLSSDLPRARVTAAAVFAGDIEHTPLLREPQFAPFATGGLRLPVFAWKFVMRWCWLTGHRSQRAVRDDFRRRIDAVADRLVAEPRDMLVVGHAGMMAYLGRELRRRGFAGPRLRTAAHAKVYVYAR